MNSFSKPVGQTTINHSLDRHSLDRRWNFNGSHAARRDTLGHEKDPSTSKHQNMERLFTTWWRVTSTDLVSPCSSWHSWQPCWGGCFWSPKKRRKRVFQQPGRGDWFGAISGTHWFSRFSRFRHLGARR